MELRPRGQNRDGRGAAAEHRGAVIDVGRERRAKDDGNLPRQAP
jgi:hypothetical protein